MTVLLVARGQIGPRAAARAHPQLRTDVERLLHGSATGVPNVPIGEPSGTGEQE
jgi:hypothetical protein